MLNDDPRPDDLPAPPPDDRPYAALPLPFSAAPTHVTSPAQTRSGPRPVRGGGTGGVAGLRVKRSVLGVTVAVVLVLLAVAALAAWRIGVVGASTPVAGPGASATSPLATPSQPGAPTSAAPAVRRDWDPALAVFYTQRLSWAKCSSVTRHLCGTVQVPVDYTRPKGDRFTLALRKVPAADPSKRVGSLLINPGGPGGSGLGYAQNASFAFSPNLLAAYDVIGFDPRGIGRSSPVACLRDRDMDQLFADDPTPDTAAEKKKLLGDVDEITQGCATRGGERAQHMSTAEVARDMDIIRVLVGDQKLNYLGVSYGTLLGALYADRFPTKVGRLVLDSAISPNQTDTQQMGYDIRGFESSIDAFINWCVARQSCALGSDKAAARGKISALLDQVEQRGLRTSTASLPSLGEGWASFGIFMCLYNSDSWPTLNQGLREAMAGQGDTLLGQANLYVERDTSGHFAASTYLQAMIPVRCADWPRSPQTPALLAEQARARKAHLLWAQMTGELYDSCQTWPTAGRTPKTGKLAVGAAPILVIGNLRDPATPIGGTKQLASDLDSGTLVTSDHDGHGTYFAGSACVDSTVDGYLLRGVVPRNGLAC